MPPRDTDALESENAPQDNDVALLGRFLNQGDLSGEESEDDSDDPERDEESEEENEDEDESDEPDEGEDDKAASEKPVAPARPAALADETVVFSIDNIDGTTQDISLREARSGYMRHADYTKKRMAESAIAREATEQRDAFRQAVEQYRTTLDTILRRDFADVDWQKLRSENPDEYLLKREELRELNDAIAAETAKIGSVKEQERAEAQKRLVEYVAEEERLLLEKLPHWRDRKVAAQEVAALRNFLRERGFTDAEIAEARDHRLIEIVRDAALYQQSRGKNNGKVRPAPKGKTLKPGAAKPAGRGAGRGKAFQQLAGTGRIRDAAAYFENSGVLDDL